MCLKSGTSPTDDARTVVSESGEILSPKYAPEIIAPAVQPADYPCAVPMPRSAIPTVATVVHELPVMSDTNAHIRHAINRKSDGVIIFIP